MLIASLRQLTGLLSSEFTGEKETIGTGQTNAVFIWSLYILAFGLC